MNSAQRKCVMLYVIVTFVRQRLCGDFTIQKWNYQVKILNVQ